MNPAQQGKAVQGSPSPEQVPQVCAICKRNVSVREKAGGGRCIRTPEEQRNPSQHGTDKQDPPNGVQVLQVCAICEKEWRCVSEEKTQRMQMDTHAPGAKEPSAAGFSLAWCPVKGTSLSFIDVRSIGTQAGAVRRADKYRGEGEDGC